MKSLRNWLVLLFVVFIWGSNWPIMKTALTFVGPLSLSIQRAAVSFLVLLPFVLIARKGLPKDRGTITKLLILGLINIVAVVPQYVALLYLSSGISAVLNYTQPLFVFCLSIIFLQGRTSTVRLVGSLIGFFGVAVLSLGEVKSFGEIAWFAIILLITGAFFWAVTIVYYKKNLTHVDPTSINALQQAMSVIFVTPLALQLEGPSLPLSSSYALMILYLALFGSVIAQNLWLWLLKEEDVTVVASSTFLIPLIAVFLGWLVLGERLTAIPILGMILILTGIYLVHRP